MRVIVALDDRLFKMGDTFYSHHLGYESFWKRYLSVFDSVVALARVVHTNSIPRGWQIVSGEGIEIAVLPQYCGPYQYLLQKAKIGKVIQRTIQPGDAVILRVPGNVSTQVWRELAPGYPYGLEVVADPWEGFAPGSLNSITRPYVRWSWTRNLVAQCKGAAAVSYVTEHALQKRYPPNGDAYVTNYSTVDLKPHDVLEDTREREARISSYIPRINGNGPPVCLGFVGSFSQARKLPDVHLKALAKCIARGANLSLEMVGDGKLLGRMKKLARELGIAERVLFRGRIPGGRPIMEAMDKFDLFLSASAAEGLPRVVIEAMARGCPCIASDAGGTPELLEHRYLVPAGNPTVLSEKILNLLKSPELMIAAVRHNTCFVRNYCEDLLQPRRKALYTVLCQRTEKYEVNRIA